MVDHVVGKSELKTSTELALGREINTNYPAVNVKKLPLIN